MDKMTMAHEYAKKFAEKVNEPFKVKTKESMCIIAENAFNLADAMQAEWEKRSDKGRPDVLVDEWQPDWSQAPDWADGWCLTEVEQGWWLKGEWTVNKKGGVSSTGSYIAEKAPSFGYNGNWQDSLRERPEVTK